MITPDLRQAIVAMHEKGMALREISRPLKLSRNTIRRVLREPSPPATPVALSAAQQAALEWLPGIYRRCKGNAVRIQELLLAEHGIDLAQFNNLDGDDLMEALRELRVDVDGENGDIIRVFCE